MELTAKNYPDGKMSNHFHSLVVLVYDLWCLVVIMCCMLCCNWELSLAKVVLTSELDI